MTAKLKKVFFVIVCLFFVLSGNSFSQCKVLAKKMCFPALSPYVQNGQLNSAKLSPGENADMQITFYSGQNYRLMVCSEGVLGDVNFKVSDADKKELFSTKKATYDQQKDKQSTKYWDFNVASTQQLIVTVEVPPSEAPNKLIPDGCVSILVGFQPGKK